MNLLPALTDDEYKLLRECLYKLEMDGQWFGLSNAEKHTIDKLNIRMMDTVTDAPNDTEWCGYDVSEDYKTITISRPEGC